MEEVQEFVDAEEMNDSNYDSDEGSIIINFQNQPMQIQHQHLQLWWEKENDKHDARKN